MSSIKNRKHRTILSSASFWLAAIVATTSLSCATGDGDDVYSEGSASETVATSTAPLVAGDCSSYLSDPQLGLVATTEADQSYRWVTRNMTAFDAAIACAKTIANPTLRIPAGLFDVATIDVSFILNVNLIGAGIDSTTLRRRPIAWNNRTQGDVPEWTEIIRGRRSSGLVVRDLTLDGNAYRMAIAGSNLIQFPTCKNGEGCSGAINVTLSHNVIVNNIRVRNGFRWAAQFGQVKGLEFSDNIIDSGNVFTDFQPHLDPGGTIAHVHSSQDGLHLVNVVNGKILRNSIWSQDSGIAIEGNTEWNWFTFKDETLPNIGSRNVVVEQNFVQTNRGAGLGRPALTDAAVYGDRLSSDWIGEGGIDVFYWEQAANRTKSFIGTASAIQNIVIQKNAVNGARYGARVGSFYGADYDGLNRIHRIANVQIIDNNPLFRAGRGLQYLAGFRNITTSAKPGIYNPTGGVGIKVNSADGVEIARNDISNVIGGLGVELGNVTSFKVNSNVISGVYGRSLALNFRWDGGEGIRVWNAYGNPSNDPNFVGPFFNAQSSEILSNIIRDVSSYGIYVYGTANFKVSRTSNIITKYIPVGIERRSIALEGTSGIDEQHAEAPASSVPWPAVNPDPLNFVAATDLSNSASQGHRSWFARAWMPGVGIRNMVWDPNDPQRWRGRNLNNFIWTSGDSVMFYPEGSQPILEWEAPRAGRVRVLGTVRKASVAGGDGVAASIWLNSALVWPANPNGYWQTIAFDDARGVDHSLELNVNAGDILSFRVDQGSSSAHDFVAWNPRVRYMNRGVSFAGVEVSEPPAFRAARWSLAAETKQFATSLNNVFGSSGYYVLAPGADVPIRPVTNGDMTAYGTAFQRPAFLTSNPSALGGSWVNFGGYALVTKPGATSASDYYRVGGISAGVGITVNGAGVETKFADGFAFTLSQDATFRLGVLVDGFGGNGAYAPDFVSVFDASNGRVVYNSSALRRDGWPDLVLFDIDGRAGTSYGVALHRRTPADGAVVGYSMVTFDAL